MFKCKCDILERVNNLEEKERFYKSAVNNIYDALKGIQEEIEDKDEIEKEELTAKEMFENLDYDYTTFDRNRICIECVKMLNNHFKILIDFFKDSKTVESIMYINGESVPYSLNAKELKAIDKQFKELGW